MIRGLLPILLIISQIESYKHQKTTKKIAFEVLSRKTRYNRKLGEEVRRSDLERECVEEFCVKEEYFEAVENSVLTIRNCKHCYETYKRCLPDSYNIYQKFRRKRFAMIPESDKVFVNQNCFIINF